MPFLPKNKKKAPATAMKRRAGMKKSARGGYRTVSLVGRSMNPIPQKMIAKHKYAETVSVSLSGAAVNVYTFNANSTWDPNRTGTGHQPYGRDTYASLYNRYRVLGCSYNASLVTSSTSLAAALGCIPANEDLTGSITTFDYAREQPRCKYILQAGVGAGSEIKNLKGYVNIASLMGQTSAQYRANENTQSQSGTSPTEAAILNFIVGTYTGGAVTDTTYLNVELVYTVEWFDPIVLGQS